MKLRITFYGILAGLLSALPAFAGNDDFGIWTDVQITKTLPYGVSLSVGGEFRANENLQNVDRWSGSFGIDYKPVKHLKLGVSYSFLYGCTSSSRKEKYRENELGEEVISPYAWKGFNVTKQYWAPRNRFRAEATGDIKLFHILKLSLRERYQFTNRREMDVPRTKYRYKKDQVTLKNGYPLEDVKVKERKRAQYLRSRLKAEVAKKGWKIRPFASFELYNNLDNELALDKTRLTVGSTYKVSKRHEVSAAYIFGNDVTEDPYEGGHAINIGYSFNF